MSKNVRTEIYITVATFVGEDIGGANVPNGDIERLPEATDSIELVRLAPLGPTITAGETSSGHILTLLGNAAPLLAERIAHKLKWISNQ